MKPNGEPLGVPGLMRSATAYLARRAVSTQQLRAVLARKLRRHGERHGLEPLDGPAEEALIEAVMTRITAAGWLDDGALAASRTRRLAGKGLPRWRIERELAEDGLVADEFAADDLRDLDEAAQARRFAQRKRLGPFRRGERGPFRTKDIAALARAGFRSDLARAIIDSEEDDRDGEPGPDGGGPLMNRI